MICTVNAKFNKNSQLSGCADNHQCTNENMMFRVHANGEMIDYFTNNIQRECVKTFFVKTRRFNKNSWIYRTIIPERCGIHFFFREQTPIPIAESSGLIRRDFADFAASGFD